MPELELGPDSLGPVSVSGGELSLRSEAERIISYRLLQWGELADTPEGWESFQRGAFDGIEPSSVVLRLDHQDPAVGRGLSLEQRADGAYMEFRVAQTPRGDELLGLVSQGIYRGASVGYLPVPGGTKATRHQDGRRHNVRTRVNLQEVGATWRPAYQSAQALQVRSTEVDAAQQQQDPAAVAAAPIVAAQAPVAAPSQADALLDRVMTRLEDLELRSRQAATAAAPTIQAQAQLPTIGQWMQLRLRSLAGDRPSEAEVASLYPELETRALAEIVSGTNEGVVPPAYLSEVIGPISSARAFLSSTRQLTAPAAGLQIIVPRIVTRPTVGVQAAEKDELTSTNTAIDTVPFDMETLGGAGDISLQLLRRSSPSFLELYMSLLGEALAQKSERRAITALLLAGIQSGGTFDPESPSFGEAFSNSMDATNQTPNRIWMSGAALAAFIDAKTAAGGGGSPMYPGLAQIGTITVGGPSGPEPMTLQPVVVPALDSLKASPEPEVGGSGEPTVPDLIVGPAMGFGWAEDGSFTLTADNPGQLGRDVALATFLWFAPLYPGAFTGYTLAA